jgi:hypothetical protein
MERAARRRAQPGSASQQGGERAGGGRKGRKASSGPPPSADEVAAFYADLVNSDQFLPACMISTTMRDVLLARGLVTLERLHARGVR